MRMGRCLALVTSAQLSGDIPFLIWLPFSCPCGFHDDWFRSDATCWPRIDDTIWFLDGGHGKVWVRTTWIMNAIKAIKAGNFPFSDSGDGVVFEIALKIPEIIAAEGDAIDQIYEANGSAYD